MALNGEMLSADCKFCGAHFEYARVGNRGRRRRYCAPICKENEERGIKYGRPGYGAEYWANKRATNQHRCVVCSSDFLSKQHIAKVCSKGCLVTLRHRPTGRSPPHKRLDGKGDRRSDTSKVYRPWYKLARWKRIRDQQLAKDPLCRMCIDLGHVTAATVCDHITPHKGDPKLFWEGPFQSLCTTHHNRDKQQEERTGQVIGSSSDGIPLDPRHHWSS